MTSGLNSPTAGASTLTPVGTQCFMLSNMFDPVKETKLNWKDEIRDEVIEECNKFGGCIHLYVDQKNPNGNVYIKTPTIASAINAVNSLHGRFFSGRVINASYIPIQSYHQLFPEAINAQLLLKKASHLAMARSKQKARKFVGQKYQKSKTAQAANGRSATETDANGKQEQQSYSFGRQIQLGMKGIFVSFSCKENYVRNEIYNLLNEFAEKLYGPEFSDPTKSENENDTKVEDLDTALNNEAKLLREQHSKKRRFQAIKSGANHSLFISTTLSKPNELIENIFEHVRDSKKVYSKRVDRLLPIINVSKAYDDDIKKVILDKDFYEQIKTISSSSAIDSSSIIKYDVIAKRSNNNHMKPSKIEEMIIKTFNEHYTDKLKRDYKQPDIYILLHVIKSFCFYSIVKNYNDYKKYNLSKMNLSATTSSDTIEEDQKDKEEEMDNDDNDDNTELQKPDDRQSTTSKRLVFDDSDDESREGQTKNTAEISFRALKLFTFGCLLAIVLMSFQYEHKMSLFNAGLILTPAIWIISFCGFGAVFIGLLYPTISKQTELITEFEYDTKKSQKIPFSSDIHFTMTLAFLCTAFWWYFDRTIVGFVFSLILSLSLSATTEILLRAGAFKYSDSDFYLKTCVPCLTFAGVILTIQLTKLLSQVKTHASTARMKYEHLITQE
ncbi:unnamed protein product [Didymodactylos carnosus]|uniref:RRM domain-containing protein n=1 Tax=Didymodactylos carnosus TaxID=1234261 RepID=A0A814TL54_9BILA|nr:unnamed protein product [Didymodactylos carnosus]CAF3925252.1 unnamed protein product [Didymodactylos carnosus]